jgi:putative transcriptional regulator
LSFLQKILRLRYFYVIINQITQRSGFVAITYRKLFHLLIDRNIKKGELQEKAGITASIMARLAKDETVKSDTIGKICDALQCQPGDIMENVPATSSEK